jgi:hypothetical protein
MKRYVVTLYVHIWAKDDEKAEEKALKKTHKSSAYASELHAAPYASLVSRKIKMNQENDEDVTLKINRTK